MRIVKRKEFLALPANTLFAEYDPCSFGPLLIKMSTLPTNDYGEQQIVDAIKASGTGDLIDKLELARLAGTSVVMDFEAYGRNG